MTAAAVVQPECLNANWSEESRRVLYLRRHDVVGDVPDAIAVDSAVNSDVELRAVRQRDTLELGGRRADRLVFVLVAALPVHHVAARHDLQAYRAEKSNRIFCTPHRVGQKLHTELTATTLPNLNRFSTFFQWNILC